VYCAISDALSFVPSTRSVGPTHCSVAVQSGSIGGGICGDFGGSGVERPAPQALKNSITSILIRRRIHCAFAPTGYAPFIFTPARQQALPRFVTCVTARNNARCVTHYVASSLVDMGLTISACGLAVDVMCGSSVGLISSGVRLAF